VAFAAGDCDEAGSVVQPLTLLNSKQSDAVAVMIRRMMDSLQGVKDGRQHKRSID
jgi:hypothetical protein